MNTISEKKVLGNIKGAFGDIPLFEIRKLSDHEILSKRHIGAKTYEYIRGKPTQRDLREAVETLGELTNE